MEDTVDALQDTTSEIRGKLDKLLELVQYKKQEKQEQDGR